jgi:hypothetical protein
MGHLLSAWQIFGKLVFATQVSQQKRPVLSHFPEVEMDHFLWLSKTPKIQAFKA